LWLARKILAGRGLPDDAKTVTMMRKRVGAALYKLRAKGWVAEVPQAGEYKRWELV
jgi:hypothetical protein